MQVHVIDLTNDLDTVEAGLQRLRLNLMTLRRMGAKVVKVIHGGIREGAVELREASRNHLRNLIQKKIIAAFCPGENFGPFDPEGRAFVAGLGELRRDIDWAGNNDGITLILIERPPTPPTRPRRNRPRYT
ncbi:MAG: hypothetical protein GX900_00370 [Clostridiaceae bacterium]|nr:hypothetical protein [Clostridiaceae bacterium]